MIRLKELEGGQREHMQLDIDTRLALRILDGALRLARREKRERDEYLRLAKENLEIARRGINGNAISRKLHGLSVLMDQGYTKDAIQFLGALMMEGKW